MRGAPPRPRIDAGSRHGAALERQAAERFTPEGVRHLHDVSAVHPHVAAAVGRARARKREQRGGTVGDESLRAAAEIEPEPGGRVIVPARSSTATARHAAAGCGRAGRRTGADASAWRSGVRGTPVSECA